MYGSGLDGIMVAFAVICMAIGAAVVGLLFWVVPMLWEWIKPWLHAVTG